jgi:hypothetical protein
MIHIIYRHTDHISNCGVGKNRPTYFTYENCLNNILSTIENIDFIKFHLIHDGVNNSTDSRIHYINNINEKSEFGSWIKSWDYAKTLDLEDNDLIYFVENDYLHIKGWPYKVKELIETYSDLSYITLYDHPHFYNQNDYPNLETYLLSTPTHHWNVRPSTTGTFMVNKEILFQDYDLWTAWTGYGDHHKFVRLSNEKNRIVIAPIPTLSTHCEVEWLAPTINWEQISKNY